MLYKEEKRLCEKYNVDSIKEVLRIQSGIISEHYRRKNEKKYLWFTNSIESYLNSYTTSCVKSNAKGV